MPRALLQQKLKSISRIVKDKWGDPTTYVLYQNVPCRFSRDILRIKEVYSDDEKVKAVAYIPKNYQVETDYIVDFENDNYIIVDIMPEIDLFGNVHHQKLVLGSR